MKELDQYHKQKMSETLLHTWGRTVENFCLHPQERIIEIKDVGNGKLAIVENFIFKSDGVKYDCFDGKFNDGDDSIESEYEFSKSDEEPRDWLKAEITATEGKISMQISLPQQIPNDRELDALKLANSMNSLLAPCSISIGESGIFTVGTSISFVGYYGENEDIDLPCAQSEATMNLLASLLVVVADLNEAITNNSVGIAF